MDAQGSPLRPPAGEAHRQDKPQRVRQSHKSVRRAEACCSLVRRIDNHHLRAHRIRAFERPLQRVREQDRTETLSLCFLRDRQPAYKRRADQRIAWRVLARDLRHIALIAIAQRV
jgi:hypothetical protein